MTREVLIDSLQVNDPSANTSSLADSRPPEELAESRATRNTLPPLRSSEEELPSRTTLASDISAQGTKKHRFEGFAKDGCITCKRRARLCDCAKPVCGKCKADGRHCLWPQPNAPQQPACDDTSTNNPHVEAEDSRAPRLRRSHTDFTPRAHPDLLPAFAYDASRRPSQRVVRLDHLVDRVRRLAKKRQEVLRNFVANNG